MTTRENYEPKLLLESSLLEKMASDYDKQNAEEKEENLW